MIKISPSILSADFARLEKDIHNVEEAGCDMLHVDVMDGHFVPNITIGPCVVEAIRKVTDLPLDVHLMIENPGDYIKQFADAGASHITVHQEACEKNLGEVLGALRELRVSRGVSLKPNTGLSSIKDFLSDVDMVLIMTVEPGFGGQGFIPEMLPKIKALREIFDKAIEVDGGINAETGRLTVEAGADVLVAGTSIFKSDNVHQAIQCLKDIEKTS